MFQFLETVVFEVVAVGGEVKEKFCFFDGHKHDSEGVIRPTYCRLALWEGEGVGRTFHCMDGIMHVHRFSSRDNLTY